MVTKYLAALAATALVAAPVAAAPANSTNLSVAKSVRSGAAATKKNGLAGSGLIIGIVAAVAVVVGIVIIADDDDSDSN